MNDEKLPFLKNLNHVYITIAIYLKCIHFDLAAISCFFKIKAQVTITHEDSQLF